MAKEKKTRKMLSSFSILFIILFVLALVTVLIPDVTSATLSTVMMAPVKGFADAIDVCVFVMILGGFLGLVTKTGALDAGIAALVKKLKGNELVIIPVLMTLFSICGSTYGMLEETVPFYALLTATMVAAGFDAVVGSAVVLLGAGAGVLGSTINPFAVGAALDAIPKDIPVNNGLVMLIGLVLWISALLISIYFVMSYAKKVKQDKGSTILSLQEQQEIDKHYGHAEGATTVELTGTHKTVLILFGITFLVMILSFIPWGSFGITFFDSWTAWLTGIPFGEWYFQEATTWFLLMGIIIGIVGKLNEKEIVDTFMDGAADMMSVVLVIALARGASVLMTETGLDVYILTNAANALKGVSGIIFAPLAYLLYLVLTFLIPSSSGLATVSMPIMAPLASELGFSPEVMVMIFVAGSGLVNLFTPTCGAIMGGLAIAKVEYSTWIKFSKKIILIIALVSVIILTGAMLII
ncbi:Na+/H+ antiporter NhaC family protein [Erysipelothrix rhusiopathiae]|uniref:C4-dicarboxylate anaerobic carrier n=1 Tax=Erysipelothrix rhusiopathiae ATCC 19414 TaxID=525280 RepID=E7FUQ0_ERYRH|nr:Na+/H+ antiporter NhaC family protein [Erysipelothrix rhusiopathiae]AGN23999.1 arginine/ornithine antiporter [Erysipelothrix rhusiopathiae SY1027]AMS11211.1 C4-dicarboxylate ABC transporter [Erysipelothrix rhusiopathiae]AOO67709.1 C4-dicarboxylate ABC transporter [Erysipelothrix rhusiopathiae]AWU41431.1 YfcC family protein [Erysipelothrix rhusiopathiae]EFY09542.1 C4-dicarboxylate anaerobic carrier [Erysipelothrix rhusiopathiae ATCC 19414]